MSDLPPTRAINKPNTFFKTFESIQHSNVYINSAEEEKREHKCNRFIFMIKWK